MTLLLMIQQIVLQQFAYGTSYCDMKNGAVTNSTWIHNDNKRDNMTSNLQEERFLVDFLQWKREEDLVCFLQGFL